MAIIRRQGNARWRWELLLAVFFLNVCLPSLVLSYGVLLVHSIELGVSVKFGVATPAVFVFTFCMSQCWFREAADSWSGSLGYRALASIGLVILVIGLILCSLIPYTFHIYIYGITGGLGTSLISAQADAVVFETYDTRLGTVRYLCFAGQAIGFTIFPHVFSALVFYYGYSLAHLLLAGIMLQLLPLVLFLKVNDTVVRPVSYSRYEDAAKTYKMIEIQTKKNYATAEVQLKESGDKSWKSPSDNILHKGESYVNEEFDATITPPPSPEEKRRNIFGIDILPDIPEESEESDFDIDMPNIHKKRFSLAIRRLSTLGDNIGDCIGNQIRRDSTSAESRDYQEIDIYVDNISPVTEVQREIIFNSFSFRCQSAYASLRRRFLIPSYRMYNLRRRLQYAMYNLNDTFIKPLTRSLSSWKFYPSMLLSFSKLCLASVKIVALPLIAYEMNPRISTLETNFMLSLYAFTWLCFLLFAPWLNQIAKRNFIYVTAAGLVTSTASCFVFAMSTNHDMFSIGCVIGGFGYGSVLSCSDTAIQDFVGSRKWPKIHSSLETLSGLLLASFMTGILFLLDIPFGLQYSFFILGILLSLTSIIWVVISLNSIYTTKIKYARISRGLVVKF